MKDIKEKKAITIKIAIPTYKKIIAVKLRSGRTIKDIVDRKFR